VGSEMCIRDRYRNYTQGDAEVFAIHGVAQSDSLKQSVKFALAGLLLLWAVLTFESLAVPIIILAII